MDLSDPMRSVVPSAHGGVLGVLARTDEPLSGRQVAEMTGGEVRRSRAQQVLHELVRAGLVLQETRPPAHLYRLNREHVAALAVSALAGQREELLRRMREHVGRWSVPPTGVWLFGSAARGDGGPDSDIDVLVIRRKGVEEDDPVWQAQISDLAERAWRWSGNSCETLEMSESEAVSLARSGERLADELRRDAVPLAGPPLRRLLSTGAVR